MTGAAIVIQGDARRLPLPDDSVDLVVTSPPYFALRKYATDDSALEIGSESTWQEWLGRLLACTGEWKRVLKPSGSMFVDLGDKYAAGHGGSSTEGKGVTVRKRSTFAAQQRERPDLPNPPASWGTRDATGRNVVPGMRPKSLMLLPERYRIACVDQLGLIARAVIVHSKPNGLPESVTDRVRRSHEDWVHLTLRPRYYSAVDEIRQPHVQPDRVRADVFAAKASAKGVRHAGPTTYTGPTNPLGAVPGSVWSIPTEPLRVPEYLGVDHFAAFASEWPRRLILGWSPPGICVECGEGRRPVLDRKPMVWRESPTAAGRNAPGSTRKTASGTMLAAAEATITGYACSCPTPDAPTRPAVILDPFGGTGTTAMIARALGRIGVTVDLSHDYSRLARWRVFESGHGAKAISRTWEERQQALDLGGDAA